MKVEFEKDGRSEVFRLEHPVRVDGVLYETVTLRRVNVREMEAYAIAMQAAAQTGSPAPALPVIELPAGVFEHLDADDGEALGMRAQDFLPRMLRRAMESDEPEPAPTGGTGGTTPPSSPASSAGDTTT